MHAMFKPKFPVPHTDLLATCQAAADKARIRFQNERLQTAFGEMQRGTQAGYTGADHNRISLDGSHVFPV